MTPQLKEEIAQRILSEYKKHSRIGDGWALVAATKILASMYPANLRDLENASLEDLREGIVWAQDEVRELCAFEAKVQAEMDRRLGDPGIIE